MTLSRLPLADPADNVDVTLDMTPPEALGASSATIWVVALVYSAWTSTMSGYYTITLTIDANCELFTVGMSGTSPTAITYGIGDPTLILPWSYFSVLPAAGITNCVTPTLTYDI
mmetsp:Transcript_43371/g.31678  ORF Transcript_43371/g.31678 Transcript_43371/m.31678 type:complete len:114 (-) Transcript_43371:328-669(-)